MASILVVDDEPKQVKLVHEELAERGHEVVTAASAAEATAALAQRSFDVVVTDLRMEEPESGMVVLEAAKARAAQDGRECAVILTTAYADVRTAVEAMRQGAADYVQKPFELDELALVCERQIQGLHLADENRALKEVVSAGGDEIVGASGVMAQVFDLVEKVAGRDTTVLVYGESGTGKELVARAIHAKSPRGKAGGPLLALNCAALPKDLVEGEIFGFEKGAFTGADRRKLGQAELANGGTLFLDEIGELSTEVQAKLLRFLETKEVRRLGATAARVVDVRVVAATNRDLATDAGEGRFREDLYYRLSVFPIALPPLRERPEDLDALIAHVLGKLHYEGPGLTAGALARLHAYAWPGNVRELRNVLERATILAGNGALADEHFHLPGGAGASTAAQSPPGGAPPAGPVGSAASPASSGDLDLDSAERRMIVEALERTGGNKADAARLLGITRRALYSRMERHGLYAPGTDPAAAE